MLTSCLKLQGEYSTSSLWAEIPRELQGVTGQGTDATALIHSGAGDNCSTGTWEQVLETWVGEETKNSSPPGQQPSREMLKRRIGKRVQPFPPG